jgi:O-antigen/teichoic acid export membrane protein
MRFIARLVRSKLVIGSKGLTILRTGVWSIVAKACSAANLFVAVPFVLNALGPLQFGAWATLVSLVTFSGFLDFGLGNGTMNLVAAAHGRGNPAEIKAIIAQGQRTLARTAFFLGLLLLVIFPFLPWHDLIGLPAAMSAQSQLAAAIVLGSIVLAVPFNLASRVQLGLGRGDRAFRWQALGQLLALSLVTLLAKLHSNLAVLTAAAISAPLLAALANTVQLRRDMMGINALAATKHRQLSQTIRREGLLFFVLQLAAALAYSADLPLISLLRGAEDAGRYAIVQRLFGAVSIGLGLVWVPLWPVYRQALAARSLEWVRRTLRRSVLAATCIAACLGLAFAIGFKYIIGLWVRQPVPASPIILSGFAIWVTIDALGMAIATFLNAASIMRLQVVIAITFSLLCISLKAAFLPAYGTAIMPWITVGTYTLISLVPTLFLLRKLVTIALNKAY